MLWQVLEKIGGSAWESNPPAALSDGTPDLKYPALS